MGCWTHLHGPGIPAQPGGAGTADTSWDPWRKEVGDGKSRSAVLYLYPSMHTLMYC